MKKGKKKRMLLAWLLAACMLITWPGSSLVFADAGGMDRPDLSALPAYVSAYQDLMLEVAKPAGAAEFDVGIRVETEDYDGDPDLFYQKSTENAINVNLPMDVLQEGLCLRLTSRAWDDDDHTTEVRSDAQIAVIGETSDQVKLEVTDADDLKSIPVNAKIGFQVSAEGMEEVQFYNGYSFWNIENNPDEMKNGVFRGWTDIGETGNFALYAKVKVSGSDEWLTSEPVVVTMTATGIAGDFSFNLDKTTVARGDLLSGSVTESANASFYQIKAERWIQEGDDPDNGYWEFVRDLGNCEKAGKFAFSTVELEPGTYGIAASARGIGYCENYLEERIPVTVTDPVIPDSGVLFNVAKTAVETGEDVDFSVLAPGADSIRVFFDAGDSRFDPESDDAWSWDNGEGDLMHDRMGYGRAGSYVMFARACYGDSYKDSDPITVQVTAPKGDLPSPDLSALPVWLSSGDDLTFSLTKSKEATEMEVNVWLDKDDYDGDRDLYRNRTDWEGTDTLQVSVAKDCIPEDCTVTVEVKQWAPGYDENREKRRISVLGEISSQVSLTVIEPADFDGTLNTLDRVTMQIDAADNLDVNYAEIDRGFGFEEAGEFRDHAAQFETCYNEGGTYAVFARVQTGDTWLYTEPFTVEVQSNGPVGSFDFVNRDAITVSQGSFVTVDFTDSKNAQHYWVDVRDTEDERNQEIERREYNNSVTFTTGRLAPGTYWLVGMAEGSGYDMREADSCLKLTITEEQHTGQPDGKPVLRLQKTQAETGEDILYEIVMPMQDKKELHVIQPDGRDEVWSIWDDHPEATVANGFSFGRSGTYEVYAVAEKDGVRKESDRYTVQVTAEKGSLDLSGSLSQIPASAEAGKEVQFPVSLPQNASGMRIEVRFDPAEGDDLLFENNYEEDAVITIPAEDAVEGRSFRIEVNAWGRSYEETNQTKRFPVTGEIDETINLTPQGLEDGNRIKVFGKFQILIERDDMEEVMFFDGYSFCDPDEVKSDSGLYVAHDLSFDEPGTYNLLAKVRLKGSDQWLTSAPITVTAYSDGTAGEFAFTEASYEAVQHDFVTFAFTESEHAEMYRIDSLRNTKTGDWFGPFWMRENIYQRNDQDGTITFNVGRLPAGEYEVYAEAYGEGYTFRGVTAPAILKVTEAAAQPAKTVQVHYALSNEQIMIADSEKFIPTNLRMSVTAPGADAVQLVLKPEEGDPEILKLEEKWMEIAGDYYVGWIFDPGSGGSWEIYAEATFGNETVTSEKTVYRVEDHLPVAVAEKAATCTEEGNIAYYICNGCGKYYADEDGTKEITKESTVVPATGHDMVKTEAVAPIYEQDGNIEYYTCRTCGKLFADAEGKTEITQEDTVVAKLTRISLKDAGVTVKAVTYTGKELKPAPVVKVGDTTLTAGTDYTVAYKNNINAGKGTVIITGKGGYCDSRTAYFTINKAASTITLKAKSADYTGKAIDIGKATVKGSTGKVSYAYYSDYACKKAVKAANVKNAGTYYAKATVAADANYNENTSTAVKLTIKKAANPMAVKGQTVTLSAAKLKNVKQKIAASRAFTFTKKAQGNVTYKKTMGNSKITVSSKGAITVKKGVGKGSYKVKVKVTAAGNKNYKSAAKTVTVTIKVNK